MAHPHEAAAHVQPLQRAEARAQRARQCHHDLHSTRSTSHHSTLQHSRTGGPHVATSPQSSPLHARPNNPNGPAVTRPPSPPRPHTSPRATTRALAFPPVAVVSSRSWFQSLMSEEMDDWPAGGAHPRLSSCECGAHVCSAVPGHCLSLHCPHGPTVQRNAWAHLVCLA